MMLTNEEITNFLTNIKNDIVNGESTDSVVEAIDDLICEISDENCFDGFEDDGDFYKETDFTQLHIESQTYFN